MVSANSFVGARSVLTLWRGLSHSLGPILKMLLSLNCSTTHLCFSRNQSNVEKKKTEFCCGLKEYHSYLIMI